MQGLTHVPIPLRAGLHYSFLPQHSSDPSARGGMSGTVPAALTLLDTLRAGSFIPQHLRRMAHANRITGPHPMRGPGWGHAWAGAVVTSPDLAFQPIRWVGAPSMAIAG